MSEPDRSADGPELPDARDAPESDELEDAITRSRMERLKLEQQKAIGRIERVREQIEAKRPHSRVIDAALGAFERDVAAGGGVLAGAVAFRVFLFMIPYVYLVVVIFGLGASASDEDPGKLARDNGIGGLAAKAFQSIGDLSTGQRIVSFFVAGFALLLATRALLKVLRIVHALVWRTRAGKPKSAMRAAALLVLVVSVSLLIVGVIGALRGESFLLGLLGTLFFVAVPCAVWVLVSWFMPHDPDAPWTALLPGAIVFGVGLEVLHLVTVYWIAREIESKTDTYGAIGFALALLLWAYLLGRLITSAAVINETLWAKNVARQHAREAARAELRSRHASASSERVEPGLGAERGDDQGELAPGQDRGGEVGGGHSPQS